MMKLCNYNLVLTYLRHFWQSLLDRESSAGRLKCKVGEENEATRQVGYEEDYQIRGTAGTSCQAPSSNSKPNLALPTDRAVTANRDAVEDFRRARYSMPLKLLSNFSVEVSIQLTKPGEIDIAKDHGVIFGIFFEDGNASPSMTGTL